MSQLPTIGHLIDGKIVTTGTAAPQDVFNPATGRPKSACCWPQAATVEEAIANPQAAYPAWRNTPPLKRARVMGNLKVLLEQQRRRRSAP
jgi:malonate-semialdehyde dehydrogenase (acetylating)/methylmalonate-semialdehyde dehydrogenase